MHRYPNLLIAITALLCSRAAECFVARPRGPSTGAGSSGKIRRLSAEKESTLSRENWTYNPFDKDDLSPLDTLLRRGPIPLGIRLLRPEKYEEAVANYMRKDGCDRATAQRSMDAYFKDPNGFVISKQRQRDLGERVGDINAPTGIAKRPVFSALWATFCFWLFFVFFPTRIDELGGINPSFARGGVCNLPVRDVSGKLVCPDDSYLSE
mmetsp:Transcript_7530/g.17336  ORF Transcript_7530/g.17336 Transcript_7530/m.17336 type:complete len:209 (+) Transcript_7530:109-735(+)